jgi:nondiscriminating glutamyl-tRNA synthetase
MDWLDGEYIKKAPLEKVIKLSKPFLEEVGRLDGNTEALVKLYQPQMKYAEEIVELTNFFYEGYPELGEAEQAVMTEEGAQTVVKAFREKLSALTETDFKADNIMPLFKQVQTETGIKGKSLWMPIRVATTGYVHGPQLHEALEILGRTEVLKRLGNIIK